MKILKGKQSAIFFYFLCLFLMYTTLLFGDQEIKKRRNKSKSKSTSKTRKNKRRYVYKNETESPYLEKTNHFLYFQGEMRPVYVYV